MSYRIPMRTRARPCPPVPLTWAPWRSAVPISASTTRKESSPAVDTTNGPTGTRNLAVTVPPRPDEPVKVTFTTTTTTTTVVVVRPPQTIPSDLLFAFDSARLSDDAGPILAAILSAVTGRVVSIKVEGHTDSEGDDGYNQVLSDRRAEAVRDWFLSQGIAGDSITVKGRGELKPVAPNDTPEHKAKNRRVEIILTVSR